jgi:hypothetical protein
MPIEVKLVVFSWSASEDQDGNISNVEVEIAVGEGGEAAPEDALKGTIAWDGFLTLNLVKIEREDLKWPNRKTNWNGNETLNM